MKLASVTFQNLFPAINVQTTRLSACQVGPRGAAGLCDSDWLGDLAGVELVHGGSTLPVMGARQSRPAVLMQAACMV